MPSRGGGLEAAGAGGPPVQGASGSAEESRSVWIQANSHKGPARELAPGLQLGQSKEPILF